MAKPLRYDAALRARLTSEQFGFLKEYAAGGKEGLVMYFARTNSLHHQTTEAKAPVTAVEIANSGIYHSTSHTTRNVHRCGSLREQSLKIELV